MRLFGTSPLFAPNEPPSDGGGGSGGGDGGDGGDGNQDSAKPLSEEDVGRIVNSAVTAHMKRLNLDGKITEAIGGLKLDEKFEALTKTIQRPGGDGEGKPKGKPEGAQDSEFQKQLQDLSKKLEESEARVKAAEEQREEEARRRRFDSAKLQLANSLKEKAHPDFLEVWVERLADVQRRLNVDDDGNATLRVKRSPFKGAPEQDEDLPLTEAIPVLLAHQDEKRFQAAPGGPSGDGNNNRGPKAQRKGGFDPKSSNPAERVQAKLAAAGMSLEDITG